MAKGWWCVQSTRLEPRAVRSINRGYASNADSTHQPSCVGSKDSSPETPSRSILRLCDSYHNATYKSKANSSS